MHEYTKQRIKEKGVELSQKTQHLTRHFPEEEEEGLVSQMNRAAKAISSNVDASIDRKSEQERKRLLRTALGSAFELEAQLILSQELGYGNEKEISELMNGVVEEQKMLYSLINKP